ncbi:hypothetical protein [Streptomyces sp. NBC_00059]|uniref:hypothetical protein n=1 Tax=Streptomyces sp. NBC_00059 TaxID=2975635 RepID=UPI0022530CD1|nr:hypothetical protein [Streptomyces sp. NBC_00059]MCX5412021.1 hypothetical protein [Streptomyces sp. NBC_00059]
MGRPRRRTALRPPSCRGSRWRKSATAARLFDIRRIIGGLFVVYGVIVTIAGINPSEADLKKAEGVHINLWTGLAMPALGLFLLVRMKPRPARVPAGAPDTPES